MPPDPDSVIVLRIPRAQKGRYVAASRAADLTLAAWITATLDAAAPPIPAHEKTPHLEPRDLRKDLRRS